MVNPANSVAITKVDASNFEGFLSLIIKLAEYEKLAPPDAEAKGRLQRDCLSDKPRYSAYLATVEGKPAAYIIYFFTYSSFLALPTLFLEDIFVLDEYRKLGVGKKLFDFIKQTAKEAGCGRIEFTVLKWNKLAQGFYAENKAKCLDDWYFYRVVKEDF
jgi:GNAT superfamily N-acetyltransferase